MTAILIAAGVITLLIVNNQMVTLVALAIAGVASIAKLMAAAAEKGH